MIGFLRRLITFGLLLGCIASGLDIWLSATLRQQPTEAAGEFPVWNALYAGQINADYVIYGSSRAWVHFNPQLFEDSLGKTAYNLGMDGQNFHLQLFRHRELVKHNPHPQNIILALDIFSLDVYEELYNETQFLPYQLFNPKLRQFRAHYKNYKPAHHFIPLLRYAGRKELLKNILFPAPVDSQLIRQRGFLGQPKSWTPEADSVLASLHPFAVQIDSQLVRLFETFLAEMQAKNTNVVLVYPPEYVAGQSQITNREAIMAYYAQQAKRFGFVWLDYSDHPISHDKTNFYNSSHLNARAADEFTSVFLKDFLH